MDGRSFTSLIALLAAFALGSMTLLTGCDDECDTCGEATTTSCSSCATYDGTGWGGSTAYRPLDLDYRGALNAPPTVDPYVDAALSSGMQINSGPADFNGIAVNDWSGVQRSAGEAPPDMALGRAPAYTPETAEERAAWPEATIPAGYYETEVPYDEPGAGLAGNGLNGFDNNAAGFNNPSRELDQFNNRDMAGVGTVDTTPNNTNGGTPSAGSASAGVPPRSGNFTVGVDAAGKPILGPATTPAREQ